MFVRTSCDQNVTAQLGGFIQSRGRALFEAIEIARNFGSKRTGLTAGQMDGLVKFWAVANVELELETAAPKLWCLAFQPLWKIREFQQMVFLH